jgi:cellulose biosynthesis protein BcsQ
VAGGVYGLDLLPSSIRLIGLQEDLARMVWPGVALNPPVMALRDRMASVLDRYDHVLLDCPPALGVITQSGLLLSHLVLVPVVPDILSVQGVLPVLRLMEAFGRRSGHAVAPVGTVISRYDRHNRLHTRILDELRRGARAGVYPPLFPSLVPDTPRIAAAADVYARPSTLRQKYGAAHRTFETLAREFLVRAERVSGVARIAEADRDVRRAFTEGRTRASAGPSRPRGTTSGPATSEPATSGLATSGLAWPRMGDAAADGFGRPAAATRPMVAPDGTPLPAPAAAGPSKETAVPLAEPATVPGEETSGPADGPTAMAEDGEEPHGNAGDLTGGRGEPVAPRSSVPTHGASGSARDYTKSW